MFLLYVHEIRYSSTASSHRFATSGSMLYALARCEAKQVFSKAISNQVPEQSRSLPWPDDFQFNESRAIRP